MSWDHSLFEVIKAHRSIHFRQTWFDYQVVLPKDLQISPLGEEMRSHWGAVYKLTKTMFNYGI